MCSLDAVSSEACGEGRGIRNPPLQRARAHSSKKSPVSVGRSILRAFQAQWAVLLLSSFVEKNELQSQYGRRERRTRLHTLHIPYYTPHTTLQPTWQLPLQCKGRHGHHVVDRVWPCSCVMHVLVQVFT